MKKICLMSVLSLGLLALSCSTENAKDSYEDSPNVQFTIDERTVPPLGKNEIVTCAETDLIAGQHYVAGQIYVTADESTVYITYSTEDGWTLSETHLFAGNCDEIPQNGGGNPKIGRFPYKATHSSGTNEVTYALDIDLLDDCFCVAAHAVVHNSSGGSETAWGEGESFPGRSWAMYSGFCIDGCTENDDGPSDDPTR